MQPLIQPSDPTLTAVLRTLTDTRQMLERVITSSESFDYIAAKEGLAQLKKQISELGRLETQLRATSSASARAPRPSNIVSNVHFGPQQ